MTVSKPKIRVCVPYPNQMPIHPKTLRGLDELCAAPDMDVECVKIMGANIAMARNAGAKGGNKSNPDAIMQSGFDFDNYLAVDADIGFGADDVRALLRHDLDIVSGAYLRRGSPDQIVAGQFDADGLLYDSCFMPASATGLQKVGWAGAGFLLIKRRVFEGTPYPWFIEDVTRYTADGVECVSHQGEDISFCRRAAAAGFGTYCDFDCRVEHLTEPQEDALISRVRQRQDALLRDCRETAALLERQHGAIVVLRELLDAAGGGVSPNQEQPRVHGAGGDVSPAQEQALTQALAAAMCGAN